MSLVSRFPSFLFPALKLQEPDIPRNVDTSIIQSNLDVYQNGWSLARYNQRTFTTGVQFAATLVAIGDGIFPPPPAGVQDEEVVKKVLVMDFLPLATLGATAATIQLRRLSDNARVVYRNLAIGAGGAVFDWLSDVNAGAAREWIIPPGWQLIVDFLASGGVGDQVQTQILWAEIPAGFNIGF